MAPPRSAATLTHVLLAAVVGESVGDPAAASAFQHFRFKALKVRGDAHDEYMVQISELVLKQSGQPLAQVLYADAMGGVQQNGAVRPPGSTSGALMAIDGNKLTKWLSGEYDTIGWDQPLYVSLTQPTAVDSITFYTADDAINRDPVTWHVHGCALAGFLDCVNAPSSWQLIAEVDQEPSTDRNAESGVVAHANWGGSSGGSGGCGGGCAFLIIFFVGGFTYFAAGFAINKYRRGKEGAEAIPNVAFWRDLPALMKDGVGYARTKMLEAKNGGYSSV